MKCGELCLVDTYENVRDTSTKVGRFMWMNANNNVESYIRYFQSRDMRWLKYASGMKEGVCVQNFVDKSSWLYLIKKVCLCML